MSQGFKKTYFRELLKRIDREKFLSNRELSQERRSTRIGSKDMAVISVTGDAHVQAQETKRIATFAEIAGWTAPEVEPGETGETTPGILP